MPHRFEAFVFLFLIGSVMLICPGCSGPEVPPNVLFIAIDDLRPELGCYGNDLIQTPNMDRIADQGFVFKKHYVQVPTCGASRCALLTGMRPRSRQHLSNNVMAELMARAPEGEYPETLIHQFRRFGYHTAGIGKISHSADGLVYGYEEAPSNVMELPYSWDEFLFDPGKWKTGWNAFFGYASGENRQSLNKQVRPYEKGQVEDDGYPDGLTTALALEKLGELSTKDQPFLLGVGYFKPHLPFTAPEKYWDLYSDQEMPLPPFSGIPSDISRASLHSSGEFNQYALGEEKASLDTTLSDDYTRKLIHAYYACVSYIDAQVGKLMQKLEELDLMDNTIVVIWGDHGWHLGDLRVWGKHTLSEYALRSTLIFRLPGNQPAHSSIESVVESVDIFPTLLDLCDIPLPGPIDGSSFAGKFKQSQVESGQGLAYGYFRNGISLRTDSFRITKYFREESPTIELYDYNDDPAETANVAHEHPEIVSRLMPLLEKGNTGLYSN
ncbi:MAG: sulfatase [Saprospiraceae bacterium]|nr:sulfatase [Saprospiraceae bacterium]